MGRDMKFDRAAAVEHAMQEFWTHGYSNVSVKALCEQLGITRSSFYHSFGSLDALFEESMDLYLSNSPGKALGNANKKAKNTKEKGAKENRSESLSQVEKLRLMFKILCKFRAKDKEHRGCLVINSLVDLNNMHEEVQALVLERLEQGIKSFEATLKQAIKAGELSKGYDVKTAAMALQTLATGINTISKMIHKERELWKIAEVTLDGLDLTSPK